MEFLKEHLGEELYGQVAEALTGTKVQLADLSEGSYVPKADMEAIEKAKSELQEKLDALKDVDAEKLQ